MPDMKFCPYCGKTIEEENSCISEEAAVKVDTNESTNDEENNTTNPFILTFDNRIIRYQSDLKTYTEILSAMQEKTIFVTDGFLKNYSKYRTFYGLMNTGKKDVLACVDELVDFAIKECRSRNIEDIDKDTFLYAELIVEDSFRNLEEAPVMMEKQLAEEQEARELDRLTRGHVMGGGFGVTGAIQGMLLSHVINSIYDSYRDSKFMDEDDAREKLNEFARSNDVKLLLAGTLIAAGDSIFKTVVDNLMKLRPFQNMNKELAYPSANLLVSGMGTVEQNQAAVLNVLKNDPTNRDVYKFFDEQMADSSVPLSIKEDYKKFSDIFGHTKELGLEYILKARLKGDSDESINRWIKYYVGIGKSAMLAKADALYCDAIDADKKYFPDVLEIINNLMKQEYAPAYVYLAKKPLLRKKTSYSAITLFTKAAVLEDRDGMYELAKCYRDGNMVPANSKKATELFIKSAKFGQPDAVEEVRELYNKGQIEGTPDVQAIIGGYNHEEVAAKAHAILNEHDLDGNFDLSKLSDEELFDLGTAYFNGTGVAQDLQKATDCYAHAANKGLYNALYRVSHLLDYGTKVRVDLYPAIRKLIRESNLENLGKIQESYSQSSAAKLLVWGIVYMYGLGEKIDLNKALHFFEEGQKTEYVEPRELCAARADYVRGLLKENEKDYVGALKFYNDSSNKKFPLGFYKLAEFLAEGKGLPKNLEKAALLYQHLADLPILDSSARFHYVNAKLCESKQKYEDAFHEMQKAVEEGYPKAMVDLGTYYESGIGVDVNYEKAVDCYNKAYNEGIPEAAYQMGLYCKNICKDEANAKAWFKVFNQMKAAH